MQRDPGFQKPRRERASTTRVSPPSGYTGSRRRWNCSSLLRQTYRPQLTAHRPCSLRQFQERCQNIKPRCLTCMTLQRYSAPYILWPTIHFTTKPRLHYLRNKDSVSKNFIFMIMYTSLIVNGRYSFRDIVSHTVKCQASLPEKQCHKRQYGAHVSIPIVEPADKFAHNLVWTLCHWRPHSGPSTGLDRSLDLPTEPASQWSISHIFKRHTYVQCITHHYTEWAILGPIKANLILY
jgi:hypothetical protein